MSWSQQNGNLSSKCTFKFHYLLCCWWTFCCSRKLFIMTSLCWTVHPFTGRRGAGLSGPGPSLPALLFHLSLLPAEQKRGAAQRRLLLHSLVCHHRDTRLQVSRDTQAWAVVLLMFVRAAALCSVNGHQHHEQQDILVLTILCNLMKRWDFYMYIIYKADCLKSNLHP